MKKLLIVSMFAIVGLTSCKKQFNEHQELPKNVSSAKKFSEIKTSENFDWKTTNEVTFRYIGVPTIEPVKTTLTIISEDGKVVLYSGNQLMSSNFETKLAIPTNMKNIVVKYGAVTKSFNTSLPIIAFDILPTLVD
jgi:hypothetical protein